MDRKELLKELETAVNNALGSDHEGDLDAGEVDDVEAELETVVSSAREDVDEAAKEEPAEG
jgi:uncharacterized protein with von Willebrand factor type A (vWA) domain